MIVELELDELTMTSRYQEISSFVTCAKIFEIIYDLLLKSYIATQKNALNEFQCAEMRTDVWNLNVA